MSEAKHTPGPWEAVPLAEGKMWGVVADMGGPGKTFLTITSLDWVGPEEAANEANARIIAAAPDLLAALEAITPHTFGHSKPGCKGKVRDPENCDTCKAIWMARDAIAKARGQEGR